MPGPVDGFDRALKLHQRPHGKARVGQAPVRTLGVGHRECREVHPGMARQRQIEFAPERRVGGLEQDLDIAAGEHGGDVAGSGRRAVGIGLHRLRGRREARPRQRAACGSLIADEMPDVVEKISPPTGSWRSISGPDARFAVNPCSVLSRSFTEPLC